MISIRHITVLVLGGILLRTAGASDGKDDNAEGRMLQNDNYVYIKASVHGDCLTASKEGEPIAVAPCKENNKHQLWAVTAGEISQFRPKSDPNLCIGMGLNTKACKKKGDDGYEKQFWIFSETKQWISNTYAQQCLDRDIVLVKPCFEATGWRLVKPDDINPPPPTGPWYKREKMFIASKDNDKYCVGSKGSRWAVAKCDGEDMNQCWNLHLRNPGDDYVNIRPCNDDSLCTQVYTAAEKIKFKLKPCVEKGQKQKFRYSDGKGILFPKINHDLCAEPKLYEDKKPIWMKTCDGSDKQTWKLRKFGGVEEDGSGGGDDDDDDSDDDEDSDTSKCTILEYDFKPGPRYFIKNREYGTRYGFEMNVVEKTDRDTLLIRSVWTLNCMNIENDKVKEGAKVNRYGEKCEDGNALQEWRYNVNGNQEFTPFKDPDLCVTPDCNGHWHCLSKCIGSKEQGFEMLIESDYAWDKWGSRIDDDDIFLAVLKENPKYCIELRSDNVIERGRLVLERCDKNNRWQWWAFTECDKNENGVFDKGVKLRNVQDGGCCVEGADENIVGETLICDRCDCAFGRNSFSYNGRNIIENKKGNCITYDPCYSSPAKDINIVFIECDKGSDKMEFDLVRPSKY